MPHKGYTWSDEYKAEYLSKPKVQANMQEFLRKAREPKPESQRQKMREAKLGKKFDDEHKHNMSETQKFRHALFKKIASTNPDLSTTEVWAQVRNEMYDLSTNI